MYIHFQRNLGFRDPFFVKILVIGLFNVSRVFKMAGQDIIKKM